jgi:hypothetical protein
MTGLSERDTSLAWLRWMKATPSPMVIEMSKELREAVNQTITDYDLIVSIISTFSFQIIVIHLLESLDLPNSWNMVQTFVLVKEN